MTSRRCALLQSGCAKVRWRSRRRSSSAGARLGSPRSSATGTSRSSPEPQSRIRVRSPSSSSNRCARPSHSTHPPKYSSSRSAESGSSEVVSVLRGFGHQMLVRNAFGQKMLECSVHHRRSLANPSSWRTTNFEQDDQQLTRNRTGCARSREMSNFGQKLSVSTPLLELTYPATIPARRTSPEAMAWMLSLATWRGASTLGQLRLSLLCIQTLTWKWWISVPEALRNGPAERLLDSLSVRVASLYRFWASIARRMEIYEFFFLDPRLISIQFEPKPKRRNLPTIDRIASLRDRENSELDEAEELETEPTPVD